MKLKSVFLNITYVPYPVAKCITEYFVHQTGLHLVNSNYIFQGYLVYITCNDIFRGRPTYAVDVFCWNSTVTACIANAVNGSHHEFVHIQPHIIYNYSPQGLSIYM